MHGNCKVLKIHICVPKKPLKCRNAECRKNPNSNLHFESLKSLNLKSSTYKISKNKNSGSVPPGSQTTLVKKVYNAAPFNCRRDISANAHQLRKHLLVSEMIIKTSHSLFIYSRIELEHGKDLISLSRSPRCCLVS